MEKELKEPKGEIKRQAHRLGVQRPPIMFRKILKDRVLDLDTVVEGLLLFICLYGLFIPYVLVVWN